MSFGALATAVVVPPLNLLPLGLAGLALSWRWPRFGRLLMAVSLLGLFAFSLPVTSRTLITSLEQGLPRAPPDRPPVAIVILGGDAGYGTGGGLEPEAGRCAATRRAPASEETRRRGCTRRAPRRRSVRRAGLLPAERSRGRAPREG